MTLKQHLAAVFDDDLHTRKWHNVADYIIIAMILLSTFEIFLSTFDIDPTLRQVLFWVDIVTLIFFTVEVSLRIWVAPVVNPKYKGWKGRLKYCFSFHGFIDVISTYPFYLQWLIPFPIAWIKALRMSRTVRLFRVSRYMKSWRLLTEAIKEKRRELLISMQFLLIITFILSLMLFYTEHDAQPDVYHNGFSSVLWAFAQYIGDPGGFGDAPPITVFGKVIACIVGLLGIAIVAVPAGILGAGFTETIEKEAAKTKLSENADKLRSMFERKLDRPTGFQVVKPYCTLNSIQARMGMTEADVIEAANETPGFRIVNLAETIPVDKNPTDRLAVEHFQANRPYGMLIDRNSPFTIVAPSNYIDPCSGYFAYYLAAIGGFNYISREIGQFAPARSFYLCKDGEPSEGEKEYFDDLRKLISRPDAWTLTYLIASGGNEPEYPTQLHFTTGAAKGDETVGDLIADKDTYRRFYDDFATLLKSDYSLEADNGRYHDSSNQSIFWRAKGMTHGCNHIILRMAWSVALWDSRRLAIARDLADAINRDILGRPGNPANPELSVKRMGY